MKKIYCGDCAFYFYINHTRSTSQEECNAPDNFIDTYWRKNGKRKSIPQNLNGDNDCGWFLRKRSFFKRILGREE